MIRTLVFVGSDALPWLRIGSDGAVTQGASIAGLLPAEGGETIAVVPGDAVAVHWTQLPALAPAQAAAAARMLAADVSAAPVETLHVALGPVESDGWRALALVDAGTMAGWMAVLAAAGVDPDRVVPAPMLMTAPESGVTVLDDGAQWQVRGERTAFAAEAALAQMLIGDAAVQATDAATWQAGLGAALAGPAIDLRQGMFARARAWRVDEGRLRRIGVMALVLVGVLLATQVAGILRYGFAADRAELQLADAARSVLPRGTLVTAPRAQVAARLAQLGGDGGGFGGMAAAVVTALRDHPTVMLHSLEFSPANGMVAVMTVPAAGEREAVVAALAQAGLEANFGAPSQATGTPLVEMRVRAR